MNKFIMDLDGNLVNFDHVKYVVIKKYEDFYQIRYIIPEESPSTLAEFSKLEHAREFMERLQEGLNGEG